MYTVRSHTQIADLADCLTSVNSCRYYTVACNFSSMSYFLAGNFYYNLCSNVTKKLKIKNACLECKLRIRQNRQRLTRGIYSTPPDRTTALWEKSNLTVEEGKRRTAPSTDSMTYLSHYDS